MAATIAAHWYQQELGSPTNEDAQSRFPFLRLPHKRRGNRQRDSNNSDSDSSAPQRPSSSKSSKSFVRPSTSRSNAPPPKTPRRQSFSGRHSFSRRQSFSGHHNMTAPPAPPPIMKQPPAKGRVTYWRKKLGVHFIPPLAYYGWGSPEEVKRVAQQSKPVVILPPNVRTATSDIPDDLIDEKEADDMILLTEMRAPSALGGLTLVDSRLESRLDSRPEDDTDQWPLRDPTL